MPLTKIFKCKKKLSFNKMNGVEHGVDVVPTRSFCSHFETGNRWMSNGLRAACHAQRVAACNEPLRVPSVAALALQAHCRQLLQRSACVKKTVAHLPHRVRRST